MNDEPETMENELEERLKTTGRRVEIALLLMGLGRNDLIFTVLEDLYYGCQIILEKYCVK